jgi:hypothetical protein
MADDVAIAELGKERFSLANIAIDEPGAIVVAWTTINVQDAMPPIEKVADDESSDSPTAACHRDAKRFGHELRGRLTGIR